MTFKEIVDATLSGGFSESQRSDAKRWVNFRYSWVWDIAEWSFTFGTATVTVTGGTVTNMPADFAAARAVIASDGTQLVALTDYRDYADAYIGTSAPNVANPEAFTVLGNSILVGPTGTSGTFTLVYEKTATPLVNDGDVPAIPAAYHLALVHGAKAEGFKLNAVPSLADSFDADFQAAITAMKAKYLSNTDVTVQVPAYTP